MRLRLADTMAEEASVLTPPALTQSASGGRWVPAGGRAKMPDACRHLEIMGAIWASMCAPRCFARAWKSQAMWVICASLPLDTCTCCQHWCTAIMEHRLISCTLAWLADVQQSNGQAPSYVHEGCPGSSKLLCTFLQKLPGHDCNAGCYSSHCPQAAKDHPLAMVFCSQHTMSCQCQSHTCWLT